MGQGKESTRRVGQGKRAENMRGGARGRDMEEHQG